MRLNSTPRLNWTRVVTVAFATSVMLLTGLAARDRPGFAPPREQFSMRKLAALPSLDTELAHAAATDLTAQRDLDAMLPRVRVGPVSQRVMWAQVAAYCACPVCCGADARGLTASGRSVAYNNGLFVAADTKLLPIDTLVQVPGYAQGQSVPVIDRGGAIKGNSIDVYFPDHATARAWGRQLLPVIVAQSDE